MFSIPYLALMSRACWPSDTVAVSRQVSQH